MNDEEKMATTVNNPNDHILLDLSICSGATERLGAVDWYFHWKGGLSIVMEGSYIYELLPTWLDRGISTADSLSPKYILTRVKWCPVIGTVLCMTYKCYLHWA